MKQVRKHSKPSPTLPTRGDSEDRLHFLKEFDIAVQEFCVDLLRLSFPAGKKTSFYPL